MQGLWKEKLSGYDRKGLKRKKITRKHILKDKAKWHIINSDNSKQIREEPGNLIYIRKIKNKRNFYAELWLIKEDISKYPLNILLKKKNKTKAAFFYKNKWFDYFTKEPIEYNIIKIYKIKNIFANLLMENKSKYRIIKKDYSPTNSIYFLYNKPLNKNFYYEFGFWTSRYRKYAQNKANRKDRRIVKDWIRKGNFEKELKSHNLSKSIAWEVW